MTWLDEEALAVIESLDGTAALRDDAETTVITLGLLRRIGDACKGAIAQQEMHLCTLLPPGESLQVPGVAQVSVSVQSKKVFHGAKLARTLAARVADSPANEDGEALPPAVLCERTAAELVDCFGLGNASQSIRTGALKKRGLKAGDFISYQDGAPRVSWMDGAA